MLGIIILGAVAVLLVGANLVKPAPPPKSNRSIDKPVGTESWGGRERKSGGK